MQLGDDYWNKNLVLFSGVLPSNRDRQHQYENTYIKNHLST